MHWQLRAGQKRGRANGERRMEDATELVRGRTVRSDGQNETERQAGGEWTWRDTAARRGRVWSGDQEEGSGRENGRHATIEREDGKATASRGAEFVHRHCQAKVGERASGDGEAGQIGETEAEERKKQRRR